MRRRRTSFFSLAPLLCLFLFATPAFGKPIPFQVGERLEYSLKWGFFPVGSATLEVLPMIRDANETFYVLSFRVRTNSFADKIYKVRTHVESVVSSDFSRSVRYSKKQSEGSTKREIEVNFDYQDLKSCYQVKGGAPIVLEIPPRVFDPLAIAYLFRLEELSPGKVRSLPTCDGKRLRDIAVRTGEREKISVPAGKFYAFSTIPEMKNLSGVFKKSPDGILKVWYSDDEKKIPVKISSKVIVGSFTANLESYRPGEGSAKTGR